MTHAKEEQLKKQLIEIGKPTFALLTETLQNEEIKDFLIDFNNNLQNTISIMVDQKNGFTKSELDELSIIATGISAIRLVYSEAVKELNKGRQKNDN